MKIFYPTVAAFALVAATASSCSESADNSNIQAAEGTNNTSAEYPIRINLDDIPVGPPIVMPPPPTPEQLEARAEMVRPLIGLMIYTATGETVGGNLGEKNADQPYNPASVTKIFIVNETLKRIQDGTLDPSTVINIPHPELWSTNDEKQYGDALHNYNRFPDGRVQEEVTRASIGDVLKAIMIGSSNIGCIALADHIYGSEAAAVRTINEQAANKGFENFQMANTSGFPTKTAAPHHYMTARAILAELIDLEKRMDDLRDTYPHLINDLNASEVTINAYTRSGATSYTVDTHSKLVAEGPLHVDNIDILKTHHSRYKRESRFGSALIFDVEVLGQEREIAYLASGFPTSHARDEWMYDKLALQTPSLIANDIIEEARLSTETVAQNEDPAGDPSSPLSGIFYAMVMATVAGGLALRKRFTGSTPQPDEASRGSAPLPSLNNG